MRILHETFPNGNQLSKDRKLFPCLVRDCYLNLVLYLKGYLRVNIVTCMFLFLTASASFLIEKCSVLKHSAFFLAILVFLSLVLFLLLFLCIFIYTYMGYSYVSLLVFSEGPPFFKNVLKKNGRLEKESPRKVQPRICLTPQELSISGRTVWMNCRYSS